MIAKLAYLTSPAPGTFVLNVQFGNAEITCIEISRGQLAGILITGTDLALRESSSNRVPVSLTESANGDDRRQQPA